MAGARGCFKSCGIGCAGLVGLTLVFGLVMGGIAWKGMDRGGRVERRLRAEGAAGNAAEETMATRAARLTTTHPGKVVLAFSEGEFHIYPAKPGEGLHARAVFDSEVHALEEHYEVLPDSSWVYDLGFKQSMPGMQALFRKIMGGSTDAAIHVYLPPEVPIDFVLRAKRGGCESDFGGLWLKSADIRFLQGGIDLDVSTPLREPLESLILHTRMGGLAADHLGNASPRRLDIDCAMGGADIDLRGNWRTDCDARLAIRMGGMSLQVPENVRLEGDRDPGHDLAPTEIEVILPVLRLTMEKSMGEIEVQR